MSHFVTGEPSLCHHIELGGKMMKEKDVAKKENQAPATPDRLDEYVRVCGTGTIVLMGALVMVFIAFLIWGLAGRIPVVETMTGMVIATYSDEEIDKSEDGEGDLYIICFADASKYNWTYFSGKSARIKAVDGFECGSRDLQVSTYPISSKEIYDYYEVDWLKDKIIPSDYSYPMMVLADTSMREHMYQTVEVSVVVDEVSPITFLKR